MHVNGFDALGVHRDGTAGGFGFLCMGSGGQPAAAEDDTGRGLC